MATETHSIVCARARPDQVQRVRNWFQELEEVLNSDKPDSALGEWIDATYARVESEWERILFGYETMVDNACDPTLSYLDFKPEIKAAMKNAATLEALQDIIKRMVDYYDRNVLNFQREKMGDYIQQLLAALSATEAGDHV